MANNVPARRLSAATWTKGFLVVLSKIPNSSTTHRPAGADAIVGMCAPKSIFACARAIGFNDGARWMKATGTPLRTVIQLSPRGMREYDRGGLVPAAGIAEPPAPNLIRL